MKKSATLIILIFLIYKASAQDLLTAGPLLGYVEHRSAKICCEVATEVRKATIRYWESNNVDFFYEIDYKGELGRPYNPLYFELPKLKPDVTYSYELYLNNKPVPFPFPLTFHTKKIWEYRMDAPDFSFLIGSCIYLNDTPYDRPQQPPYGQDPVILNTMAETQADFNIWLGDNLYFRESDYSSPAGMNYRYSYQMGSDAMAKVLVSRPNYAIWDDHDFGPNDSHGAFELKETALDLFKSYWGNKSYGEHDNPGIYGKFQYSDCDFFLMDDRYYRSPLQWKDSIDDEANCNKHFWGEQQLQWLKDQLISSRATFKFIVNGSQVLNAMNTFECMQRYPCEFNDLMTFIDEYKIDGLVFLSGDRHLSEVIKIQNAKGYPLYDITSSPLTSSVFMKIKDQPEFNNPARVSNTLVLENNFTRLTVSTKDKDRVLKMQCINKTGDILSEFSVAASEVMFK